MADGVETIESTVLGEVAGVIGVTEVRPEQRLADFDLDSVMLLRLIRVLQDRFEIGIDVVDMFTAETTSDLVVIVEEGVRTRG